MKKHETSRFHHGSVDRNKNAYTDDWKSINLATCVAAGHRCIRCHHPYEKGQHGNGQWSPCDDQCNHLTGKTKVEDGTTFAEWRILTVHHFNGDKADNSWWNLMALCQRCHLSVQSRVNPDVPWFLDHSEWIQPYVAGFYALKYRGLHLSREEVNERLEELLKLAF